MFKFQPSCLFFWAKRHCPMLGGFSTNMLKPYTGCQCFPKDACNPLVVVYCCPFKFFLLVVFSIPHDVIIYLFLIVRYLKISKLLYLIQYGFCSMWCSINVYIVVMQSLATMPHLIFILIVYRHECIVENSTMLTFRCLFLQSKWIAVLFTYPISPFIYNKRLFVMIYHTDVFFQYRNCRWPRTKSMKQSVMVTFLFMGLRVILPLHYQFVLNLSFEYPFGKFCLSFWKACIRLSMNRYCLMVFRQIQEAVV